VRVSGPRPRIRLAEGVIDVRAEATRALKGTRRAYFPETEGFVEVPVYERSGLWPGSVVKGPAIVEEREATTVVGPGDLLRVDASYNLRLEVGGR